MKTLTIIYAAALVALGVIIGSGYAQAAYLDPGFITDPFPPPQQRQNYQRGQYQYPQFAPDPPPVRGWSYCHHLEGGTFYCTK